jgi:hypothetical protein
MQLLTALLPGAGGALSGHQQQQQQELQQQLVKQTVLCHQQLLAGADGDGSKPLGAVVQQQRIVSRQRW